MQSQPLSLDELKTAAQKYKVIKRDEDNAPWVPLNTWNGFSGGTNVPNMSVQVDYYLEGNRVLVRKALDDQAYWYTLG